MGWSIGYDARWKRDIGYGVPAVCDAPKCETEIDRGLAHVCGGEQPYGGDSGCGLYFCSKHLFYHAFRRGDRGFYCKRCGSNKPAYEPKADVPEWIQHKLTDESWEKWRQENPQEVALMKVNA